MKPSDRIRQIATERYLSIAAATMLYLDEREELVHPIARAHSLALPDRPAALDLEMLDRGPAPASPGDNNPDLIHGVGHRERLASAPCRCIACVPQPAFNAMMRVCQLCGNKRCPHTEDHRNVCTNSNDTDQRPFTWGQAIALSRQLLDEARVRSGQWKATAACYRLQRSEARRDSLSWQAKHSDEHQERVKALAELRKREAELSVVKASVTEVIGLLKGADCPTNLPESEGCPICNAQAALQNAIDPACIAEALSDLEAERSDDVG